MEKYKSLINKNIETGFAGGIISNSLKIISIAETNRVWMDNKIFHCKVDWKNKNVDGVTPYIDFDEKTLDDLLNKGISYCPIPNHSDLFFRITPKYTVGEKNKYFIIQNSQNLNQFLKPYPNPDSKTYIWGDGLLGSAGFEHENTIKISKECNPIGNIIPMDNLAKEIVKEK